MPTNHCNNNTLEKPQASLITQDEQFNNFLKLYLQFKHRKIASNLGGHSQISI
jgi:hypothetical protein